MVDAKREELEMIMVRSIALWRAWAAVTWFAEIVRDLGPRRLAIAKSSRRTSDVVHAPVAKRAARRVWIIDDKSKAFGPGRRLAPADHGRVVGAVTGISNGDWLPIRECIAREAEFRHLSIIH